MLSEFEKDMEKRKADTNKLLRDIFGKYEIKGNFLIRIKEEILKEQGLEILKIYPVSFSNESFLMNINKNVDFELCKHITMTYLFDKDKHANEDLYHKQGYSEQLKSQIITRSKLNHYENINIGELPLIMYNPLIYVSNIMANYMIEKYDENIVINKVNYKYGSSLIMKMVKNSRAILQLIGAHCIQEALTILRTLIENLIVYMAIRDNEIASEEYFKFMNYLTDYEIDGEYPQEFIQKFDNSQSNNKTNYLNYGWIDSISAHINKRYTIEEVANLNSIPNVKQDQMKYYIDLYKKLCRYSHGNYADSFGGDVSLIIFNIVPVLINISQEYEYWFETKLEIDGICLIDYLKEIYEC